MHGAPGPVGDASFLPNSLTTALISSIAMAEGIVPFDSRSFAFSGSYAIAFFLAELLRTSHKSSYFFSAA
jgi:hypothetical protein